MSTTPHTHNVVLIGMPGAGKSTLGVLLAKWTSRHFIDTDVVIQARERRTLQTIIDTEGLAAFRHVEERAILDLRCDNSVIATGGSVVYSDAAMQHLRALGIVVYLQLDLPHLQERLHNLPSRGVVMTPGQTLAQLFAERTPLYARYADTCLSLIHI